MYPIPLISSSMVSPFLQPLGPIPLVGGALQKLRSAPPTRRFDQWRISSLLPTEAREGALAADSSDFYRADVGPLKGSPVLRELLRYTYTIYTIYIISSGRYPPLLNGGLGRQP